MRPRLLEVVVMVGAAGGLALPGVARGQLAPGLYEPPAALDEEETPQGTALTVGGGVVSFLGEGARGRAGVGGVWDVRLTFGLRQVIGLELAYRGSAQQITDFDTAFLLGNGAESVFRLNTVVVARGLLVTPFALAGVGWTRYDVMQVDRGPFQRDVDHVFTTPLGAGFALASDGVYLDARFTYRPTFDESLLPANGDLATWELAAHIGAEF